jgi:small subunit ribosomal protein S20
MLNDPFASEHEVRDTSLTPPAPAPKTRGFPNRTIRATGRMANTASARKRIRQIERRTARNKARKSRVHTFVRKVEAAIAGGDRSQADAALRAAQPELQRAAGKGVLHPNTMARRLSRLSARVRALPAG